MYPNIPSFDICLQVELQEESSEVLIIQRSWQLCCDHFAIWSATSWESWSWFLLLSLSPKVRGHCFIRNCFPFPSWDLHTTLQVMHTMPILCMSQLTHIYKLVILLSRALVLNFNGNWFSSFSLDDDSPSSTKSVLVSITSCRNSKKLCLSH